MTARPVKASITCRHCLKVFTAEGIGDGPWERVIHALDDHQSTECKYREAK